MQRIAACCLKGMGKEACIIGLVCIFQCEGVGIRSKSSLCCGCPGDLFIGNQRFFAGCDRSNFKRIQADFKTFPGQGSTVAFLVQNAHRHGIDTGRREGRVKGALSIVSAVCSTCSGLVLEFKGIAVGAHALIRGCCPGDGISQHGGGDRRCKGGHRNVGTCTKHRKFL